MLTETVFSALVSVLEPMLRNQVYVARSGLIVGLKRRGGFGFLPKKTLAREHMFLGSLDFKGKTIYDVGGYIGLITLFFVREVGETGRVVTFEPYPQSYSAIHDHLRLNGFTNVRVIQMGLGDKQETLRFMVSDHEPAKGTVDNRRQKQLLEEGSVKILQIEIDTMDNQIAVNNLPDPDFVKIDVEGFEIRVLHGMFQTISNYRPEMLIELHGTSEREIAELLLSYNYNIYQIEDDIDITQQNIDMVRGHLYIY